MIYFEARPAAVSPYSKMLNQKMKRTELVFKSGNEQDKTISWLWLMSDIGQSHLTQFEKESNEKLEKMIERRKVFWQQ